MRGPSTATITCIACAFVIIGLDDATDTRAAAAVLFLFLSAALCWTKDDER